MDEEIKVNFESVCSELNIDEEARDKAWAEYQTINNDYVLEGPHIEWLACSLYVACRSASTQTVEGEEYIGNSISLTQILRATKLRLVEFFRKIKKWLEMARLPPSYLEKVEALERKFEVISVIFKKYNAEYSALFQPRDSTQRPSSGGGGSRPRSRKPNKAKPCSSQQLFQFGWVLYVYIKNQFPLISDDLVNSHYLLLCCLDTLCAAVITSKRNDLLNQSFDGFPEGYDSPSFSPATEFPWVLPQLCVKFSAIEKECRVVRDYYWWPSLRRLYESQTLHWAGPTSPLELQEVLPSVLNPSLFQSNLKSLNNAYELMVFQEGDFDEREFLSNQLDYENYSMDHRKQQDMDTERIPPGIIYQSPRHLQYGTPLTGREYLSSKETKLTPVSDANQSVIQLHLLLEGCGPTPCDELVKVCSCCPSDPLRDISLRLKEMSDKFLLSFKADSLMTPDNFALVRLQLSQTLYYKVLAAVVSDEEKKITSSNLLTRSASLQSMLEHDLFHKSLFALCVEIILFSYNSHSRIFPWVLGIMDVSPFHFYKVIEVVIKVEPGFPRTVVKHLSKIEESVLSSLAWKSESPLFDLIDRAGSIPCYADVALPESPYSNTSPLRSRLKLSSTRECMSPLSARERYSTPTPGTSRRQLFTGKRPPKSPSASPLKPPPIAPKPPPGKVQVTRLNQLQGTAATATLLSLFQQQTSPQKPTDTSAIIGLALQALINKSSPEKGGAKEEGGDAPATPGSVPKITVSGTPQKVTTPTSQHPKRTGSAALFYRKVYQMSFLRIKDLCERLLLDAEIMKKVWTCFEYSLMRSSDLMRDRHIDQLIMCSIYVVAKVLRKDVTFQEIMRQYRHQPQAKSHVYRSVLLNNGHRKSTSCNSALSSSENKGLMEIEGKKATRTTLDTTAAVAEDVTDVSTILFRDDIDVGTRGDIIQFYNKIFIGYVKDYVLKFSPDEDGPVCSMSPLPVIRRAPVSPRKLSKNHQIFISPLKGSNQSSMSPLAKTFVVSKSPASDLLELNNVVGSSSHGVKLGARRQLNALLSSSPVGSSPAKRPYLEGTAHNYERPLQILNTREAVRTSLSNGGSEPTSSVTSNNNT